MPTLALYLHVKDMPPHHREKILRRKNSRSRQRYIFLLPSHLILIPLHAPSSLHPGHLTPIPLAVHFSCLPISFPSPFMSPTLATSSNSHPLTHPLFSSSTSQSHPFTCPFLVLPFDLAPIPLHPSSSRRPTSLSHPLTWCHPLTIPSHPSPFMSPPPFVIYHLAPIPMADVVVQ